MRKMASVIIVLALLLLFGGGLFLATWEIPVPANDIERTIPNERFTK
ncbi:MAG: hypothetical protein CFH41_00234 [Alphaproteobacteria bacterium MarineAlpha11_Bin1]|nr:MAG: hypothetical protein CFH41_00234 [Alphaproteobacteria bacterium MarineAlpha11_Bin1]